MWVEWAGSALGALALDQASKAWALGRGEPRNGRGGPRILAVSNPRIGLGVLRDRRVLAGLWSAVAVGVVLSLYFLPPLEAPVPRIALGAALGGATGNLIDRLWRGAVVDFIDLRVWPVFNFADICIVGGVMVAIFWVW